MTKIFGDTTEGKNYIEVRRKISLIAKRNFANTAKTSMAVQDGAINFKMISADLDSDIVLLRSALVSITTDGKTKEKPTIQDIDDSIANVDNFEQAIEFLKRENKLGEYGKLEELSKEELIVRRENIQTNLNYVDKLIEAKGN